MDQSEIGPSTRLISRAEEYITSRKDVQILLANSFHFFRYSAAEESAISNGRPGHITNWRSGAKLAAICAFVSFVINTIWTIWGLVKTKPFRSDNGGIGTIFEGECSKARKLDLWVHLAINALSRPHRREEISIILIC
jgi:hypothetical protein